MHMKHTSDAAIVHTNSEEAYLASEFEFRNCVNSASMLSQAQMPLFVHWCAIIVTQD